METIFDACQRKAVVEQTKAEYDNMVAKYRQTVLTAFQQVEDNLAALRILARQADQQEVAVKSSERFLNLAMDRYKLGIDSYLTVITAQTTLLVNRETLVNLHMKEMTASVQLIEALGGLGCFKDARRQEIVLESTVEPTFSFVSPGQVIEWVHDKHGTHRFMRFIVAGNHQIEFDEQGPRCGVERTGEPDSTIVGPADIAPDTAEGVA